jgi:hypothetical protein
MFAHFLGPSELVRLYFAVLYNHFVPYSWYSASLLEEHSASFLRWVSDFKFLTDIS